MEKLPERHRQPLLFHSADLTPLPPEARELTGWPVSLSVSQEGLSVLPSLGEMLSCLLSMITVR